MAIEKVIVLGGDLNFRSLLEKYLRHCSYEVASDSSIASAWRHAARLLEVSIRTLRNKLHEYKEDPPSEEKSARLSFA